MEHYIFEKFNFWILLQRTIQMKAPMMVTPTTLLITNYFQMWTMPHKLPLLTKVIQLIWMKVQGKVLEEIQLRTFRSLNLHQIPTMMPLPCNIWSGSQIIVWSQYLLYISCFTNEIVKNTQTNPSILIITLEKYHPFFDSGRLYFPYIDK